MSNSKLKICGVERDNKACNFYRILQPLDHIQKLDLAECVLIDYDSDFDAEENLQKVFGADIVLLPRPSSEEWFGFVKAAQKAGKLLVSDYDDDPFTCDPFNPYYRWIGIEEWQHKDLGWVWKHGMVHEGQEWFNIEKNMNRRDMVRASFKKSDMVTCTTPELAEVFKAINPNTIVLPNFIDLEQYPVADIVKKKVRIGWQGGVSHYRDLHLIKPALAEIAKLHPDVELVYFGDSRLGGVFKDIPNFEFHNFVHHVSYPYKLKLLNLDIGICPLEENVFNVKKSAIKYFEYSAVGAATIASDIAPYNHVIDNFKDGVLVPNDTKCWVEALDGLIKDRQKIKALATNAYENVKENHTIQKNAHQWVDAYRQLIEKEMEVV